VIWRGALLAGFLALPLAAQEASDGVLESCLGRDNTPEVCVCASAVMRLRLGDDGYAEYNDIETRIAALNAGAEPLEGEMDRLVAQGFKYFVPHGKAISLCQQRFGNEG